MRWLRKHGRLAASRLDPALRGFLYGAGAISLISALFSAAALLQPISAPSPALLRDLTEVSVGVFLALGVATAGAGIRAGEDIDDHLNWLGTDCGIGVSGLIAIGASVGLAAHREAGHSGAMDIVGLCWILTSVLIMGLAVAILPYVAYSWKQPVRR